VNSPKLNTLILNGIKQSYNENDALHLIQIGSTEKEYNQITAFFKWCKKQSKNIRPYNIASLWSKFEKDIKRI
jgi:hypothetical protein